VYFITVDDSGLGSKHSFSATTLCVHWHSTVHVYPGCVGI